MNTALVLIGLWALLLVMALVWWRSRDAREEELQEFQRDLDDRERPQ